MTDESVHDERRVPTSTGRRGWVGVDRNWLTDDRLSDSGLRLMLWLESHTDEYLAAMNVKRTAEALGWKRDRVRRHLDALTDLGLISVGQEARKYGGTVSRITLHLDAWTDGPRRATDPETDGPRRASAVAHGEARAVAYREAPTNSTNSVSTAVEEHTAGGVVSVACPTFEQWYRWWPKKQGRAAAEKRWAKMTAEDRNLAAEATALWVEYARLHPEGTKYVPMASTFLTQKRWLDEMPLIPKPVARESGSTAALRAAMQNRMNQ